MKKKNAIGLAVLAFIAGGVTIGGISKHNQKEKEEIEKELKEILIPGAEKALDSLQQKRASTIASYEEALKQMENQYDSLERITNQADTIVNKYGKKEIVVTGPMKEIQSIIDELIEQCYDKNVYFTKDMRIPGDRRVYDPELTRLSALDDERAGITNVESGYQGSDYWPEEATTFYVDWFFKQISEHVIPSTVAAQHQNWSVRWEKDSSAEFKIEILESIKDALAHIGRSKGVFNDATLKKLNVAMDKLLQTLHEQVNTAKNISRKAAQFKAGKKELDKAIDRQYKKVDELKGPDIVKKLREQKNHDSR